MKNLKKNCLLIAMVFFTAFGFLSCEDIFDGATSSGTGFEDPLPPTNVKMQSAWHQKLSSPKKKTNEALVKDYKALEKWISDNYDYAKESVFARESELDVEIGARRILDGYANEVLKLENGYYSTDLTRRKEKLELLDEILEKDEFKRAAASDIAPLKDYLADDTVELFGLDDGAPSSGKKYTVSLEGLRDPRLHIYDYSTNSQKDVNCAYYGKEKIIGWYAKKTENLFAKFVIVGTTMNITVYNEDELLKYGFDRTTISYYKANNTMGDPRSLSYNSSSDKFEVTER